MVHTNTAGDESGLPPLQTEFEFTLPQGYVDEGETLHREGAMRLATAADEILPLKDPRVKSNESYLTVILLSRVVTHLGSVDNITPHVMENLFVSDLAYLQDLYERVNRRGADVVDTACPACGEQFEASVEPGPAGRAHAAVPASDESATQDTATVDESPGDDGPTPEDSAAPPSRSVSGSRVRIGEPLSSDSGVGSGNSEDQPRPGREP